MLKEHNGLPPNYAGKLGEFLEEKSKALGTHRPRVKSLQGEHGADGDGAGSEYTESEFSEGEREQATRDCGAFVPGPEKEPASSTSTPSSSTCKPCKEQDLVFDSSDADDE